MNTITIAFKFIDCNDDTTKYSNRFVFDSLIIDFRNVDETIRYKVSEILIDYDFTNFESIAKDVYEYDCYCELNSDLWELLRLLNLVELSMTKIYTFKLRLKSIKMFMIALNNTHTRQ